MKFEQFAKAVGIDKKVMERRMKGSVAMGASAGPKPKLSKEKQQVVVDTMRRYDRANNGQSAAKAASLIQELNPKLTRKQATNGFAYIRKQNKDVLTGDVLAQQSTSKRSEVTVSAQQYWHETVESVRTELRKRNTGLDADDKTFADLEDHFFAFLDETSLQASSGKLRIVGDKEKAKHEKTTGDSRESITMVRTGSAKSVGPTIFLLAGQRKRGGFTDQFLAGSGAAPYSTIVMTPTAFMTDEAWVAMAEDLAKGIRAMPVIKDHPDWWVCLILDGYLSHVKNLIANAIFNKLKILLLKELADMSHVNQTYDQEVAVDDKNGMRDCLSLMRTHVGDLKGVLDQYSLVHAGLHAVRETGVEVWEKSAIKVNLCMSKRKPFAEWIVGKSHFLEGGLNYKRSSDFSSPEYLYSLAPAFWQGMTSEEKKNVMAIIDRHDGLYTVACVNELHSEMRIPLSDMQDLRVCREMALKNPTHLEMVAPAAVPEAPLLEEEARLKPLNNGLATYELKPAALVKKATEGKDAMPLYAHMIKFNRRMNGQQGADGKPALAPSPYLGIEMYKDQRAILAPSPDDMTVQSIMKCAGGAQATRKVAKRKLSALGDVNSLCGIVNDNPQLEQQKRQLQLAVSLAEISAFKTAEIKRKKDESIATLTDQAPGALMKYVAKGNVVEKLTMKEINSILTTYFFAEPVTGAKPAHVKALESKINARPNVLTDAYALLVSSGAIAKEKETAAKKGKKKKAASIPKPKNDRHLMEEDEDDAVDDDDDDDDNDDDDEFDEELLDDDDEDKVMNSNDDACDSRGGNHEEQTTTANEDGRIIDANEVSALVLQMPPTQLVGLRLETPYNGEKFLGTIKEHLELSEGHRFVIKYDDGDVEVMDPSRSEFKYVKDIDQLRQFITAAYVSKKAEYSDLRRNAQSSNKRLKRSIDDSVMHYGPLPEFD